MQWTVEYGHPYNDGRSGWVEISGRRIGREVESTGTSTGDGGGGSW